MDHMRIIKRAWNILWSYRALWVFGIILALTSASGGNGGGGSGGGSPRNNGGAFPFHFPPELAQTLHDLSQAFDRNFSQGLNGPFFVLAIVLACLALLIGLIAIAAKYVSRVALIRMVDRHEESGEKLRWTQGLRLGWSRNAWKLFLIDLVVFLPVMLGLLVLFGCAAIPILVSIGGGNDPTPVGIIATIGMAFLVIFLLIIVIVALSMFMELAYRHAVLNSAGVIESVRHGWKMLRASFREVFLMWLILIGIGIAVFIGTVIVFILLLAVAAVFGGGIGAGLFFLVKSFAAETAAWITAGVVGGLIALVTLGVPLAFLGGLRETFLSTVWTLTFRELNLPRVDALAPLPESPEPLVEA